MSDSFVSVIIPVFNDSRRLKLCLQALSEQTYSSDRYEVIVVDNASTDEIESTVQSFSQVVLIHESQPGSYAARNKGISKAKGDILAFTDSDCIPDPAWIVSGVKRILATPNCGIAAGNIEFFFQQLGHPNAVELYDSLEFLKQQVYAEEQKWAATANLFTFRHVFEDVGLFDANLRSGGDLEWGKRVSGKGYEVVYAADGCVAHPARSSIKEIRKKLLRTVGGRHTIDALNPRDQEKLTKSLIAQLRPPLRSAIRKSFLNTKLKTQQHKFKIFSIIFVLHYLCLFEMARLYLGGSPNR